MNGQLLKSHMQTLCKTIIHLDIRNVNMNALLDVQAGRRGVFVRMFSSLAAAHKAVSEGSLSQGVPIFLEVERASHVLPDWNRIADQVAQYDCLSEVVLHVLVWHKPWDGPRMVRHSVTALLYLGMELTGLSLASNGVAHSLFPLDCRRHTVQDAYVPAKMNFISGASRGLSCLPGHGH